MDKIIFNNLIELLNQKVSHEKVMLEDMRNNPTSIPKEWSLTKQMGFIKGMEHSIAIIKNPDNYQD